MIDQNPGAVAKTRDGLPAPVEAERLVQGLGFTSLQNALLRTALGRGDVALEAWREWTRTGSLDSVDHDFHMLLPLVHHNLTRLGVEPPDLRRLGGIRRYWWTRNQLRLRRLGELLNALDDAGVPAMVVGDCAVIQRWYADIALRPLGRIEIMVREIDAGRALEALTCEGCRYCGPSQLQENSNNRLGVELCDAEKMSVGLRWRLVPECLSHSADDTFWDHAQTGDLVGRPVTTPCASDMLLALCCASFWSGTVTPQKRGCHPGAAPRAQPRARSRR